MYVTVSLESRGGGIEQFRESNREKGDDDRS